LTLFAGAALLAAQLHQRGLSLKRFLLNPAILGLLVPWLCLGLYCLYQAVEFGRPHAEIAQALRRIAARLQVEIHAFSDMSVDEVARETRLSLLQARLAKLPEYGERFCVRDRRAGARGRLIDALNASHLRCVAADHYDYVGAPVENSLGVALLRTLYHRAYGTIVTVGLADALADDNVLQLVDRRVIVGEEDPARGGVDVAGWARAIVEIVEEVRSSRACGSR